MKKLVVGIFIISGALLTTMPSARAQSDNGVKKDAWKLTGRSASYFDRRRTNGEGADFSDTDGEYYREELSLYLNRTKNERRMGLDMRSRFSNDKNVDSSRERLQYLRGYYENDFVNAELGDVAASFTPYVFSAALKGAKLSFNEQKRQGWQAAIIGGVQKASWAEITSTASSEQPDRWVGALSSSYIFDTAQAISLSMATAHDDNQSGDYQTVDAPGAKVNNIGGAVDWRFNRYFTTKAEMAYMRGTENMRDDVPTKSGLAAKIRLYTKPLPRSLRSNFLYEYVDSDFHPVIGSGSADLERIENSTSYYFNRQLRFRLALKHSRDNLNGALGDTQKINDATLNCSYRPDFLKRGDLGLRGQIKTSHGRGADLLQQEAELNMTIRPKPGWRYGAAYIFTDIDDNASGAVDQRINAIRGTLGWLKRFSEERVLRSTINLDYRYISEESGSQNNLGGKIDMGYDGGKSWSADLLAQTSQSNRAMSDNTKYSAYQVRGTYHPGGDSTKSWRLSAEERLYGSDTSSTDQTYNEDVIEISYLFSI